MFFDTMAGIVERHMPEMVETMRQARIFRTEPTKPGIIGAIERWHPDERTIENFRLPFPIIAVERAHARTAAARQCVVLSCKSAERREFDFICGSAQSDGDVLLSAGSLVALPGIEQDLSGDHQDLAQLTSLMRLWIGSKKTGMRQLGSRSNIQANFSVSRNPRATVDPCRATVTVGGKTRDFDDLSEEERRELAAKLTTDCEDHMAVSCFLNCCIGVLSVLIINEPACFVVEERPLIEPRFSPFAIRRSADRPQFIVLKPRQIRTRFMYQDNRTEEEREEDAENNERLKRTPHERRGHYRRLQSERFKKARGAVLWIDPVWIGPSEFVKGPNRYAVRLDL